MTTAPAIEILQRLPYWKDGETYVLQLGDLFSGENRRFVIDIEVPGIAALGLCKLADLTIEYLNLADRQEISVTLPVNVNVVPGDVAAGRVADPVVRAERLILDAQSSKAAATEELLSGDIKEAASRLKGTAANLRRQASLIPVTDERSAESLELIKVEADEIDALAKTAEENDVIYASKRMTESYSRKTRAKNDRNQIVDPTTIPDEFLN